MGAVELVTGDCWERSHRLARREIWLMGGRTHPVRPGVTKRAVISRTDLSEDIRLITARRIRQGEAIRVVDRIPAEMAIVDRACVWVPVTQSEALMARRSNLLTAFVEAYETWWRGAIPLSRVDRPVDERLVTLLATGLTDKSIARELGIGLRTVQRQVRELLGLLSSRTRFQAGLQVGRMLDRS